MRNLIFIILLGFLITSCNNQPQLSLEQIPLEPKDNNKTLEKFSNADSAIYLSKIFYLKYDSTLFPEITNVEILNDSFICINTYVKNSRAALFDLDGNLSKLFYLTNDYKISSDIFNTYHDIIQMYDLSADEYSEINAKGEVLRRKVIPSSYSNIARSDQNIFMKVWFDPELNETHAGDQINIFNGSIEETEEINMPAIKDFYISEILPFSSFHILAVKNNFYYISSQNFKLIKYDLAEKNFKSVSSYNFPNTILTNFPPNIEKMKKIEYMQHSNLVDKLININNELLALYSEDCLYFFDLNCNYISTKKIGYGLLTYSKNTFYLLDQPKYIQKKFVYPQIKTFIIK